MSAICLINPPQTQLREPTAYIPLGLAYVAAKHPSCTVVNWASGIVEEELPHTDLFGITCQKATFKSTKEVIDTIRKMRPNSHIIVGGALPSADINKAKELGADKVFTGIYTDIRQYLPDRSKFKREHFIDTTGRHGATRPSTHVMASSGCTYQCKFCEHGHEMYNRVIFREPSHIIQELNLLHSEYGVDNVRFNDDCFTINKQRTINLCKALANHPTTYICMTRADRVDSDILRAMSQSGCLQIMYGVESGSQRILDAMNKGMTVEQNIQAIHMTKDAGIKTKALLIYGFPRETDEDREKTLDFVRKAQPDLVMVSHWSDDDFFYPDDDIEWKSFREKVNSCISIQIEKS